MLYLSADPLRETMVRVLAGRGVDVEGAGLVAEGLVTTSLRGTDSHGIQLFPHYCRATSAGRIKGAPAIKVHNNAPSVSVVDADHAFGHVAGVRAMDEAIRLASDTGVGAVSVGQSTHFGAAAFFAQRAANTGTHLGFAFTNADALVQAYGARDAFFGTNPICFTAPMDDEAPLCLDMATSTVSWNRIRNDQAAGVALEEGWAFDAEGQPTVDAKLARSLAAIGAYKGFGLGMMIEILCGVLAGGPTGRDLLAMYGAPITAQRSISHFFVAVDIRRFLDPARFRAHLSAMATEIRSMPARADEPVCVPGDPEKSSLVHRSTEGIPISEERFDEFLALDVSFQGCVR